MFAMIVITSRSLSVRYPLSNIFKLILCAWLALPSDHAYGQTFTERRKVLSTASDSVVFDTLSVVPGSVRLVWLGGNSIVDSTAFLMDHAAATLKFFRTQSKLPDSVEVVYRVFPILLTRNWYNRDRGVIEKSFGGAYNPFSYQGPETREDPFKAEGLQRSGNIARGISFGNNQDAVVSSAFNLQMSGKIGDDIDVLAAITDNNIPVQPEGNTQQIQDFDKVFIQLSKNKSKLIAGDFELRRPDSYFMNMFKKAQGGIITSEYASGLDNKSVMRTSVSGAISKGKYARKPFDGLEGNQGPYKLTGSDNEPFIIILSGSEKVFIDGKLLIRGESNDYVIDYNTAEIRFTPNQPITKDKRIVVEFQYSDKNYARTMFFINQEYEDRRWKVKANIFSEQDSKNQPLLQDLDNEQKSILAAVGDSIFNAVAPSIDSVAFNTSEVLYEKIDSAGYVFYRYSTDSTKARYRLGFSVVGRNRGNYEPIASSANGRVFTWIEPINGIPQGSYEPVSVLVSPKKQQLFTFGADYKTRRGKVYVEGAMSRNDINLFSKLDKADDTGLAIAGGVEQTLPISRDTVNGWRLQSDFRFEHVNARFKPLEQYRSVEFSRDWNLSPTTNPSDELAISGGLRFIQPKKSMGYRFRTFQGADGYAGYMNMVDVRWTEGKYVISSDASWLFSNSRTRSTSFLRSNSQINRKIGRLNAGVRYEQERNLQYAGVGDTLLPVSRAFDVFKFSMASPDSGWFRYSWDVSRRNDRLAYSDILKEATTADELTGRMDFYGSKGNRLSVSTMYRNLMILDSALAVQAPEETFLTRVDYNGTFFQGGFVMNTFYEAGSGQELKKEYAFLEVAPGTGVYTYAGDYNGNGVKDLDEFEVAAFADQANYVKIFLPTNEYVRTRNNQFSHSMSLNPAAWYAKKPGKGKFISRFANQTSYRAENRLVIEDVFKALFPFDANIDDSVLVATARTFRSTLFFNRNSTVFSMDLTRSDNRNKSILSNGYESRRTENHSMNARWNITSVYGVLLTAESGIKANESEFFKTRDYRIESLSAEPRFSIQPNVDFRVTLGYKYQQRENVAAEKSVFNTGSAELRYSPVTSGLYTMRFSVIDINYNAAENTPIAYEMLEGLRPGTNLTWSVGIQRNLSKSVQISINYEGRKPEEVKTIHTGTMQARAFF